MLSTIVRVTIVAQTLYSSTKKDLYEFAPWARLAAPAAPEAVSPGWFRKVCQRDTHDCGCINFYAAAVPT